MKIIDLLIDYANDKAQPRKIKYRNKIYVYDGNAVLQKLLDDFGIDILNNEIEILDEEDKDIPFIPDDELYEISNRCTKDIYGFHKNGCDKDTAINYNFKVLKEKINQVVKEFNEYRKDNE